MSDNSKIIDVDWLITEREEWRVVECTAHPASNNINKINGERYVNEETHH